MYHPTSNINVRHVDDTGKNIHAICAANMPSSFFVVICALCVLVLRVLEGGPGREVTQPLIYPARSLVPHNGKKSASLEESRDSATQ